MGELLSVAVASKFTRLARGNAFFDLWDEELSNAEKATISCISLNEVIQRNTSLTTLQKNIFFLVPA